MTDKTNVLLLGDVGTGKTHSVLTLLAEYTDPHTGVVRRGAGQQVLVLSLEPGAKRVFGPNGCAQGLHQHYIPQTPPDWDTVAKYVSLAHVMDMSSLIKMVDPGRAKYTQFFELFALCKDYTCTECGQSFGDIAELGPDHTAVLDSQSGLNKIVMQAVVGGKPIRSQAEYGNSMDFIEAFLSLWWGATGCNTVLLAHRDREVSPLTGLSTITLDTWGQKLAPKLVKVPDEIVMTKFEDGKYLWSTIEDGVILKRRSLPLSPKLEPDFRLIFKGAA